MIRGSVGNDKRVRKEKNLKMGPIHDFLGNMSIGIW